MARLLFVHGLGGSGATMAPLAADLAALGHHVITPTLPGHGATPDALVDIRWSDWLTAVVQAAGQHRTEVIIGQSLGGALALAAAATVPVRAVVAINPPAPDPDALDGLEWRRERGHQWIDGAPLEDGEPGYDTLPISALIEMTGGILATDMSQVAGPVLLITSALDEVVDPASADVVAAAVRGPIQRLVLSDSGHTAVLGPERAAIARAVHDFVCTLGL